MRCVKRILKLKPRMRRMARIEKNAEFKVSTREEQSEPRKTRTTRKKKSG